MRVGLGHTPIQLRCLVRGDNILWQIDGLWHDFQTSRAFRARGITLISSIYNGDEVTQNLTASINIGNNNTNITCYAASTQGFPASPSNVTIIFIAGI